ncbi:MAG: CAP domain-containing protein [Sporichthyaceae bacterium]
MKHPVPVLAPAAPPMPHPAPRSLRRRTTRVLLAFALTMTVALAGLIGLGRSSEAEAATTREVLRAAVLSLTNVQRAVKGCPPLRANTDLRQAAQAHANDMANKNYFSHTSKNGTVWWKRIERYGYKDPAGENIARGYSAATAVVTAWMKSPGHRANIMNCKFRKIGVGFNGDGKYWVQDFGY